MSASALHAALAIIDRMDAQREAEAARVRACADWRLGVELGLIE